MTILRKIYHATLQFDLCVSVMVTKYSQSASLNWKLSFVWRQILISFSRKSHSGQPVVHPWESLEWSPWFAGIPLNWSWIGGLSIAARPVEKLARALCSKISSEKLNWTESRDRLHTHLLRCCLHNQSFYHRRKISRADMSPHLLLGGVVVQSTGHWWVVGTVYSACTVGGSLLASSPTVVGRSQTHCTPGRAPALVAPACRDPYY